MVVSVSVPADQMNSSSSSGGSSGSASGSSIVSSGAATAAAAAALAAQTITEAYHPQVEAATGNWLRVTGDQRLKIRDSAMIV